MKKFNKAALVTAGLGLAATASAQDVVGDLTTAASTGVSGVATVVGTIIITVFGLALAQWAARRAKPKG